MILIIASCWLAPRLFERLNTLGFHSLSAVNALRWHLRRNGRARTLPAIISTVFSRLRAITFTTATSSLIRANSRLQPSTPLSHTPHILGAAVLHALAITTLFACSKLIPANFNSTLCASASSALCPGSAPSAVSFIDSPTGAANAANVLTTLRWGEVGAAGAGAGKDDVVVEEAERAGTGG